MAAAGVLPAVLALSCGDLLAGDPETESEGMLVWSFADVPDAEETRAGTGEIPDTNAFLLTVKDAAGKVLYDGTYGASPTSLMVSPGSYTVSARSTAFQAPAFSKPLFGDDQVVIVEKNRTTRAVLRCSQLNAGVRLRIASSFPSCYPTGTLHLKASAGSLLYGIRESRIAYFQPGPVSLLLSDGGVDRTLLTRSLAPAEILTLSVAAQQPGTTGGSVSIEVDTLRNWTHGQVIIGDGGSSGGGSGGSSDGQQIESAYSVPDAKAHLGEEGVWVYGYIVGGDLSSSGTKMNTQPPFSSNTHLTIAVRSSVTTKSECLSVELRKGEIRTALNLVDHPDLLGRQVFLCGNLVESYYGIPGLKACSAYTLKR